MTVINHADVFIDVRDRVKLRLTSEDSTPSGPVSDWFTPIDARSDIDSHHTESGPRQSKIGRTDSHTSVASSITREPSGQLKRQASTVAGGGSSSSFLSQVSEKVGGKVSGKVSERTGTGFAVNVDGDIKRKAFVEKNLLKKKKDRGGRFER